MDRNLAAELEANADAIKATLARIDAIYDEMAREHAEGRIGGTHILSPNPIVPAIEVGRDAA